MQLQSFELKSISAKRVHLVEGHIAAIRIFKDGDIYVQVADRDGLIGTKKSQYINDDGDAAIPIDSVRGFKLLRPPGASKESPALYMDGSQMQLTHQAGTIGMAITDAGVQLSGNLSITAHPEDIRIGGIFRMNGALTSTVPSTILTPVPTLVMDIPVDILPKQLLDILNEIKDMIGI